jgi:glycosyltransferase involved in cell wall biosynthesis
VRILFLSAWFPYPADNGSKIRIFNLIRGLSQEHHVTLLSFTDETRHGLIPAELRQICQEVQVVPKKSFSPLSLKARLGFFSLTPRSVLDTFSSEMAELIRRSLTTTHFDVIIASQVMMAGYSRFFSGLPALFEEIELGVLYEQRSKAESLVHRFRHGLTWTKHRRYLARLLRGFRAGTVVSRQEHRLLCGAAIEGSKPIEVIPNCVNVAEYEDFQAAPRPNTLIFTGSFSYFANYQAMRWFTSEVLPNIRAEIPDVRLTVTGNHANRPLPQAQDVELAGYVEDVRPYIAGSWVSLAPIWTGGGTRLKILEAMALCTPVVATSKGAEGIDVLDEENILIADTPQAFADAVTRLLRDPGLRQRLVDNAYRLVCRKYDWAAVMPRFVSLVERVALG